MWWLDEVKSLLTGETQINLWALHLEFVNVEFVAGLEASEHSSSLKSCLSIISTDTLYTVES